MELDKVDDAVEHLFRGRNWEEDTELSPSHSHIAGVVTDPEDAEEVLDFVGTFATKKKTDLTICLATTGDKKAEKTFRQEMEKYQDILNQARVIKARQGVLPHKIDSITKKNNIDIIALGVPFLTDESRCYTPLIRRMVTAIDASLLLLRNPEIGFDGMFNSVTGLNKDPEALTRLVKYLGTVALDNSTLSINTFIEGLSSDGEEDGQMQVIANKLEEQAYYAGASLKERGIYIDHDVIGSSISAWLSSAVQKENAPKMVGVNRRDKQEFINTVLDELEDANTTNVFVTDSE